MLFLRLILVFLKASLDFTLTGTRATLFQLIWYLYGASNTDYGWCSGYLAFSISWHAFGSKIKIQKNLEKCKKKLLGDHENLEKRGISYVQDVLYVVVMLRQLITCFYTV